MTDERIAELLGWPTDLIDQSPSGLFRRIHRIVAEAQAEQSAQIERMRAALTAARSMIEADRLALLDCHTDYTGRVDEDGRSAAAGYDALLRQIDEAMGETNEPR